MVLTPEAFLTAVIDPILYVMEDEYNSPEARIMLLAIALQETALEHRRQVGGPARGWFQFEKMGGTNGVMQHAASCAQAEALCATLVIPFDVDDVYEAIAWNDMLSVGFARLLLYTDPAPLPLVDEQEYAWEYYLRNWRPGKPHPETWPTNWNTAVTTVLTNFGRT